METVLYIIWILIPASFLLLALWEKFEQWSTKRSQHGRQAAEFLRQSVFLAVVVALAFFINAYFIDSLATLMPSFIPKGVLQVALVPALLCLGAVLLGGSKPIRISKAPRTGGKKK